MRKAVRVIAVVIALLLIAGLGLRWYVGSLFNSRDTQWYADYTVKYGDLLKQIAETEVFPQQSLRARWALGVGGVESIHFDPDVAMFFLNTSILEGYYVLLYSPDADYISKRITLYDDWRRLETTDGSYHWEGGMFDRGNVHLYDLGKGFYLEEAYLPT